MTSQNHSPAGSATPAMAASVQLHRNPHGRLVLTLPDGTAHEGVVPVRAFPIAAPQRQLLEEELAVREFVPTIEKIVAVSSFSTPSTWDVITDRGAARLVLKAEEDIRRLAGRTRLLIAAGEGGQFKVPDTTALDKHSRKLLERFL